MWNHFRETAVLQTKASLLNDSTDKMFGGYMQLHALEPLFCVNFTLPLVVVTSIRDLFHLRLYWAIKFTTRSDEKSFFDALSTEIIKPGLRKLTVLV